MLVQRIVAGASGLFVFACIVLSSILPTVAQTPPILKLVEVRHETGAERFKSITSGSIRMELNGQTSTHTWNPPPDQFDANGFDITVTAQGNAPKGTGPLTVGTAIYVEGYGLEWDTDPTRGPYFEIAEGKSGSQSMNIHIKPAKGFALGRTVELWVGASHGPGVWYRYEVVVAAPSGDDTADDDKDNDGNDNGEDGDGDGDTDDPNDPGGDHDPVLAVGVDCPPTIVITQLPSLNCHLIITGFTRNTATPVEVILPKATDGFGNHENGIQIDGAGRAEVFNWDQSYSWGLFVFACPGQQGAGVNCHGSVTEPGPTSTPIVVRQGKKQVVVDLLLEAITRSGRPDPANFGGKWTTTFGDMFLTAGAVTSDSYDIVGDYPSEGGTITAKVEGNTLLGIWLEPDSNQKCTYEYGGTEYWGSVLFVLSDDGNTFTGSWGYCNEGPTRPGWDGVRQ